MRMRSHMKERHLTKIGAGAIMLAGISLPLNAASVAYTSGHGDIGVGYDASVTEFEPHWHMGVGAVIDGSSLATEEEYAPGDLVAIVSSTRLSPNGLAAGIGVPDGSSIRVAGSAAYQPNLGFAVEELDPANWTGIITLTLTAWTLPSASADFAMYTTNLAGTSVVETVFSTHSIASTFASNSFTMTPGDHVHFQFGFTEPGNYDLELTWTGMHKVDGNISTTDTFRLHVIPEPTSVTLIGLALGLAGFRRRR